MTVMDLKSEIVGNTTQKFYIFTGSEIGIQNIYINQIAKNSLTVTRVETVQEVYGKVKSTGMFANEAQLYIVRGDKAFQKEEKNWQVVLDSLGDNKLILLYDSLDSRLKFTKFFKDSVVEFLPLDKPVLLKYINKKIALSGKYAEELIDICSGNYDICMQECEKINTYMDSTKTTADDCYQKLVKDGTIYQSNTTDVFQWVDVVCKRNITESFRQAKLLQDNNAQEIVMLGALYNSLKAIMLIQSCNGDIQSITGLDNGAIYYNKKRTGHYSVPELVSAIQMIADTVEGIKTGKIESIYSIEYILIHLL